MATEQATFARLVLTVVAAVLWFLGWLAGKVWAVLVWTCTAVKVGWTDAHSRR